MAMNVGDFFDEIMNKDHADKENKYFLRQSVHPEMAKQLEEMGFKYDEQARDFWHTERAIALKMSVEAILFSNRHPQYFIKGSVAQSSKMQNQLEEAGCKPVIWRNLGLKQRGL